MKGGVRFLLSILEYISLTYIPISAVSTLTLLSLSLLGIFTPILDLVSEENTSSKSGLLS